MTTEAPPGFFHNMGKATGAAWQALPEQLAGSAMLGAAGAAVAGVGVAAHKIYDAATKTRDFRRMLAFDQDLAQQAKENPKLVNQAFTTLRTFNKPFSSDPMVASSYVKTLITNPQGAASTVGAALSASGNLPNAIGETFNRSAVTGLQFKDLQKAMKNDLAHQHSIMTMKRDIDREGAGAHEFSVARARAEGQGLGNLTHAGELTAAQESAKQPFEQAKARMNMMMRLREDRHMASQRRRRAATQQGFEEEQELGPAGTQLINTLRGHRP